MRAGAEDWRLPGRGRSDTAGEKISKLIDLMAHLRGPEGCPWDREQDYDSVKGMLLEEAYEVVDAVNAGELKGLEEELGDLLFQVVFYSRLAEEEGRFTIDGVIEHVYEKLIRRHPHVFGKVRANNAAEALQSWLNVKEQERRRPPTSEKSVLDGIAPALPATLEAYEVGLRVAELGFDWNRAEDVLEKIEEEIQEIRHELRRNPPKEHPDSRKKSATCSLLPRIWPVSLAGTPRPACARPTRSSRPGFRDGKGNGEARKKFARVYSGGNGGGLERIKIP